ncbi:MAG: sulfate ABC transporter substrate-binding protein [Nocardioides sp.]
MTKNFKVAAVAALAGALALTGCSGEKKETVDVVGFSILKSANEDVFKAFEATDDGKNVTFKTSYGASGDQSRAVAGGQSADVVHFSLETDVTRLVDEGKVAEDWNKDATKGVLTSSVVVFVVRPGNPDNIKTWEDLIKPGVEIITPNPASSGSARWNILAGWGHVLANGGTDAEAEEYTSKLIKNTINLPGSGREATSAFVDGGQGDVLLSYENEAILAKQQGQDVDYVIPPETLLIENTGALTKGADDAAKKFFDFLHTEEAQKIYATTGFRPVGVDVQTEVEGANDPSDPFPAPEKLLTITDDFGGWSETATKFFDEENGIIPKLLAEAGKETE